MDWNLTDVFLCKVFVLKCAFSDLCFVNFHYPMNKSLLPYNLAIFYFRWCKINNCLRTHKIIFKEKVFFKCYFDEYQPSQIFNVRNGRFSVSETGGLSCFKHKNGRFIITFLQYASISVLFLTLWFLKTLHQWNISRQDSILLQILDSRQFCVCFSKSKTYDFEEKSLTKQRTESVTL